MALVGRDVELEEFAHVLDRAGAGHGEVLVLTGPRGAGKTALADAAVDLAHQRGFRVLRGGGPLVWAQLARDLGVPDEIVGPLLGEPDPLQLDDVARRLVFPDHTVIVVDDVDRGGPAAVGLLAVLAGRIGASRTVVVATATTSVGTGRELRIGGLAEDGLATVLPSSRALWVASRGLPGVARTLAALDRTGDPIVTMALNALSANEFLDTDVALIRLLELAVPRAPDDVTRAHVLARLARELVGDASAHDRRRDLVAEALRLAGDDPSALADVLDARLVACWDPLPAQDRLDTGARVVALARTAADTTLELKGFFWQFVALVELGRLGAAESVLGTFERLATAAGSGGDVVMALSRHAMIAALRGRFDAAEAITDEVVRLGMRFDVPDTRRLVATVKFGMVGWERADRAAIEAELGPMTAMARRFPGHFFEATAARMLTLLGRDAEAATELERVLPTVLAGSGPRWVAAMADLGHVAVVTGDTAAAERLYAALEPFAGRLVVWGGASTVWGGVSYQLGRLAGLLGRREEAVVHLKAAAVLDEEIGALPALAHSQAALADLSGDEELRRRAGVTAERLGMALLLERLAPPVDEWRLGRDGDDWLLRAGSEVARLRDSRGLHYLRALLSAPGKEISALDLAAGGSGLVAARADPVLDDTALKAYRARLAVLDPDDPEREALLAELRRLAGLGARRRAAPSEAERARVNVTRTLRAALGRIAVSAPRAAAHLQASVRTGLACRYEPAPGGPTRWRA